MSGFAVHISVGTAVSIAVGSLMVYFRDRFPIVMPLIHTIPLVCSGTMFGSLYPDTDVKSKSGIICNAVLLGTGVIAGLIFKKYYVLGVLLGMFLVPMFSKHRSYTHNILFNLAIVIFIWFLVSPYLAVGYFIGFLCHKCLD